MSRGKRIVEFLPETKKCRNCGKVKDKDKFNLKSDSPDGLTAQCRNCIIYHKQYRWNYYLEYKHGITEAQYKLMLKSQNEVCKICKQSETIKQNGKIQKLSVDHCHKTGKIRSLLCYRCNLLMGRFENNPGLLEAITEYLEENK